MSWNTNGRKQIDVPYESVIVKQEDDGSWTIRKANYHKIEGCEFHEDNKQMATGHAHGIAHYVTVEEN